MYFNLQIQRDEPGKQSNSIGHGRKRRRIWYATCSYGAELPALSLNGIEGCHEVHPPSGARVDGAGDNICLCATPFHWFQEGLGHQYRVHELTSMDEMLPSHGMRDDLSEFFLMDVILNRSIVPPRNNNVAEPDPDSVVLMVQAYGDGDLVDDVDFKYQTLVAILPGAGVFYCACERRRLEVVATRPTYSLMQVGFSFERMLWWLPTTNDFQSVSVDV